MRFHQPYFYQCLYCIRFFAGKLFVIAFSGNFKLPGRKREGAWRVKQNFAVPVHLLFGQFRTLLYNNEVGMREQDGKLNIIA